MPKVPNKLKFYHDIVRPCFSVWLPFFVAFCITYPICLYHRIKRLIEKVLKPNDSSPSLLCLEAGVRGWEIIEYKEAFIDDPSQSLW